MRGDQFAVCLALIEGGKTILSVIGCPNMLVDPTDEKGPKGVVFVARKGHGAYMVRNYPKSPLCIFVLRKRNETRRVPLTHLRTFPSFAHSLAAPNHPAPYPYNPPNSFSRTRHPVARILRPSSLRPSSLRQSC